jgi:hypothetical protein
VRGGNSGWKSGFWNALMTGCLLNGADPGFKFYELRSCDRVMWMDDHVVERERRGGNRAWPLEMFFRRIRDAANLKLC